MEKQKSLMGKKCLLGVIVLLSVFAISLVSASQNLQSPINWGNYSTTINFSCRADMDHVLNASLYYNVLGASADNGTGVILVTIVNSTANQSVFENPSVSISGLADGRIYNMTCIMRNGTSTGGSVNATSYSIAAKNVTFDSTPPNVSSTLIGIVNRGNYTGATYILNITANDVTMGMSSLFFNITYSNGNPVNFSAATLSGGYYSVSIDTTTFADGFYNLTVYANDTLNNKNTSTALFLTFDKTSPTGSVGCLPFNSYTGDEVTCSCSANDATSGVKSTSFTANPSTDETGEFNQYCTITDYAGNSATVGGKYVVNLKPRSRALPITATPTQTPSKTENTTPESTTSNSDTNPQTTGGEQQAGMILGMPYWVWIIIVVAILAVLLGGKYLLGNKKKKK